jgi:hypothetical protein
VSTPDETPAVYEEAPSPPASYVDPAIMGYVEKSAQQGEVERR